MNPFDALLVPPALVKRALDDLHDIAVLARRFTELEAVLVARVEGLEDELVLTRTGVQATQGEIAAVRQGVEALNGEIKGVREGVESLNGRSQPCARASTACTSGWSRSATSSRSGAGSSRSSAAWLPCANRWTSSSRWSPTSTAGCARSIPKLDEMQESIEPIGDLAEKIPGNRRRRDG